MPQTPLPNLGYNYEWDLAQDGWKNGMDANWVRADSVGGQPFVIDRRSSEPAGPAVGDAHILIGTPSGTNWGSDTGGVAGRIALYTAIDEQPDDSPWLYLEPRPGWRVYDRTVGVWWRWDGSAWMAPAGGVRDTTTSIVTVQETDAGGVITLDDGTPAAVLIDEESNEPFPIGGDVLIVNRNAAAADVVDGAAVNWLGPDPTGAGVLAQGAWLRARKVGADEWLDIS